MDEEIVIQSSVPNIEEFKRYQQKAHDAAANKFFGTDPESNLLKLEAKVYALERSLDRHRFWFTCWGVMITICLVMKWL